jgi:hypothetical protein
MRLFENRHWIRRRSVVDWPEQRGFWPVRDEAAGECAAEDRTRTVSTDNQPTESSWIRRAISLEDEYRYGNILDWRTGDRVA